MLTSQKVTSFLVNPISKSSCLGLYWSSNSSAQLIFYPHLDSPLDSSAYILNLFKAHLLNALYLVDTADSRPSFYLYSQVEP